MAEVRHSVGLTQKELGHKLGLSLWDVERLERGEIEAVAFRAQLEELLGSPIESPATATPPAIEPAATSVGESSEAASSRPLDDDGKLVLGAVAVLVLVRFFTEVTSLLPRAINFVDVPIVVALCVAAIISHKPTPRLDRFSKSLVLFSGGFLLLAAIALVSNFSRIEPGPALVFLYGILSPFAVYRAVLKLWPAGHAISASRLIVGLGLIQLVVAATVDVPRFIAQDNPDVVSGTFGTNAYQFVFFMILFVTLLTGIYVFERDRPVARFAPFLIAASLAFVVLAQYRALLLPMGLAFLLISAILASATGRGRGFLIGGVTIAAFTAAFAFGAQKIPILKLNETLEQNPAHLVEKRLDITNELKDLYEENPRFVVTGTGPGTYSSRGWQTFAQSESKSKSNVQGGYAKSLTGGHQYRTDVSEEHVVPLLQFNANPSVAGSQAANSPFAEYTSVAAEVGIAGALILILIYAGAFAGALRRARRSLRPNDALPALLLAVTAAFLVLLQMGALDNWLEVTRLTFIVWALFGIAVKEFDSRLESNAPGGR